MILENRLLNMLAEEAEIYILRKILDLLKGEPFCLFNLFRVLRERTVFLRDTVDVVLSCLIFLVAHIVLGEGQARLLLELTECTR